MVIILGDFLMIYNFQVPIFKINLKVVGSFETSKLIRTENLVIQSYLI
jgi:hypothetical protein